MSMILSVLYFLLSLPPTVILTCFFHICLDKHYLLDVTFFVEKACKLYKEAFGANVSEKVVSSFASTFYQSIKSVLSNQVP